MRVANFLAHLHGKPPCKSGASPSFICAHPSSGGVSHSNDSSVSNPFSMNTSAICCNGIRREWKNASSAGGSGGLVGWRETGSAEGPGVADSEGVGMAEGVNGSVRWDDVGEEVHRASSREIGSGVTSFEDAGLK